MSRLRTAWTRVVVAAGLPVMILSGCDGGPSAVDERDPAAEVEQAVLQAWADLPGEEGMDLHLREAQPSGSEGAWALPWASMLAGEAEEARAGGEAGAAPLVEEGRRMMAEAAVETFGAPWAARQVAGVAAALGAVEQAAAGALRGEQAALVGQARAAMASAAEAPEPGTALAASLGASEALRMLAPEAAASEAIRWARGLLERAETAAAGLPEFDEALANSARHLAAAIEAFEAGRWRDAVQQARSSAALSRRILGAVEIEDRPGDAETAAQRALQVATELYVEAEAAVGTGGTDARIRLLAEARTLLDEAQQAFTAGDFPRSLRLALRSATISRRLVNAAMHPGGSQAGAERAIQVAAELYRTVAEKLGEGGTVAQQEALERASRLLEAADAALQDGENTKAIRLAVEAASLCRRLLISLR